MHFLKQLIELPILSDPAKNYMNVHRHFYRYSRGSFIGPALKISKTSAKITLKGSHEYEDLILELVTQSISNLNQDIEIKGKLVTGSDISELLSNLGLNWDLKRSSGQTKNYTTEINDKIKKKSLLEIIEAFRKNCYFLISFNINPNCKVTTKKKIPQPSKKKVGEDEVNKRIQFSTGYINNTNQNLNAVIDQTLPDFKSELPEKWKAIIISNNYKIKEIELPKDIKDSRLIRIMAIRSGKLIRSVEIDDEIIEKQYNIVV
ncbi:MAG: hypothetical protein ACXACC_06990 [Promethearchaeota archaeon]|jgi:hypothetical protein